MTNKIIPQRDAFWDKILEKARADKNVIVISADMGAPSLDVIRKELPSQFINVGIAEQNAIIIGAGLALTGKKVFVYAIAPFITIRCLEQIRVECGIMNIPMTIVGVGVGFGYEDSGPTHHLLEDIAMMRCLPNMTIHTMTDSNMSSSFGEIAYESNSPNYIRVYRQTLPDIYDKNHDFRKGLSVLKKSKDYYIVSCGSMTHTAIEVSEKLAKNKINIGVIDAYTIPINQKLFLDTIKGVKKIITMEENFLPGGLGSTICEILSDNEISIPVKRLGLPLEKAYCYEYGGRDIIRAFYGLDNNNMERKIKEFIKK
ncbi:MAG TPA: 1-deoxy-D-xylulose-5-phosphate synthase [Elusimicrobia bacterium]|nr:1-deoxy-D-xylulose-5-phosphate synthase [Elusimicrobiota bacterium]